MLRRARRRQVNFIVATGERRYWRDVVEEEDGLREGSERLIERERE